MTPSCHPLIVTASAPPPSPSQQPSHRSSHHPPATLSPPTRHLELTSRPSDYSTTATSSAAHRRGWRGTLQQPVPVGHRPPPPDYSPSLQAVTPPTPPSCGPLARHLELTHLPWPFLSNRRRSSVQQAPTHAVAPSRRCGLDQTVSLSLQWAVTVCGSLQHALDGVARCGNQTDRVVWWPLSIAARLTPSRRTGCQPDGVSQAASQLVGVTQCSATPVLVGQAVSLRRRGRPRNLLLPSRPEGTAYCSATPAADTASSLRRCGSFGGSLKMVRPTATTHTRWISLVAPTAARSDDWAHCSATQEEDTVWHVARPLAKRWIRSRTLDSYRRGGCRLAGLCGPQVL